MLCNNAAQQNVPQQNSQHHPTTTGTMWANVHDIRTGHRHALYHSALGSALCRSQQEYKGMIKSWQQMTEED
jgi:hypothetical protein